MINFSCLSISLSVFSSLSTTFIQRIRCFSDRPLPELVKLKEGAIFVRIGKLSIKVDLLRLSGKNVETRDVDDDDDDEDDDDDDETPKVFLSCSRKNLLNDRSRTGTVARSTKLRPT